MNILQKKLKEMLEDIDEFFKENEIKYFLIGGSVLGAIRHKGFIPWDDDIDIGLYREDFEKFECLIKKKSLKKIKYSCAEEDMKRAPAPYGCFYLEGKKVEYIIDVYPIDRVPNNIFLKKIQKYMSYVYHFSIYRKPALNRGEFYFITTKFCILIFPNFIYEFLKKLSKYLILLVQNFKNKQIVNMYGIKGYDKEVMPKEYIGQPILKEFEGDWYYIPEQYDKYLTHLYGNYMILPSKEKRVPKHGRSEEK